MPRGASELNSHLSNFHILTDELVKAHKSIEARASSLSGMDQLNLSYSSFGGQLLFRNSIVTPILKQALSQSLADLPWFAGRLMLSENGRTYDVSCSNAGARLLIASTSATLEQLTAVLAAGPHMAGDLNAVNPIAKYALSRSPDVIVKQRSPLSTVMLVHLSGGGSLLVITAYHGMVDFEGLQIFVRHLSAAYNHTLLARRGEDPEPKGTSSSNNNNNNDKNDSNGDNSVDGSSAKSRNGNSNSNGNGTDSNSNGDSSGNPVVPLATLSAVDVALPASTNGQHCQRNDGPVTTPARGPPSYRPSGEKGFFAPDLVAALADAAPPSGGCRRRERIVALPSWKGPLVLLRIMYLLMFRGGGVQARLQWVPLERLASLKKAAMEQLRQAREKAEEEGTEGEAQRLAQRGPSEGAAIGCGNGGVGISADGQTRQRASGSSGWLSAVEWVSTRDCLAARMTQLLHATPLKRLRPMIFLIITNLRPRMQPTLPPNQLGNFIWGARVDNVRPTEMGLGELAARIRLAIRDLPAEYCEIVRQVSELTAVHAARQLISELIIHSDVYQCLVAPEGPVIINEWRVQYDFWQFGPEPPLSFTPTSLAELSPNLVVTYPPPPAPDGTGGTGLCMITALHRMVWHQLDQLTGGDIVAALQST